MYALYLYTYHEDRPPALCRIIRVANTSRDFYLGYSPETNEYAWLELWAANTEDWPPADLEDALWFLMGSCVHW